MFRLSSCKLVGVQSLTGLESTGGAAAGAAVMPDGTPCASPAARGFARNRSLSLLPACINADPDRKRIMLSFCPHL